MKTNVCSTCNKVFEVKSRHKKRPHTFCSQICYWKSMRLKKLTKKCLFCKRDFVQNKNVNRKTFAKQKYCSIKCSVLDNIKNRKKGELANHWTGGVKKSKCSICGCDITYKSKNCRKCRAERKLLNKIKKKKQVEYNKKYPKRPWNYIEDRTKLKREDRRNDALYKEWRKNVYCRDSFKCVYNNKECNGRIEAHHIIPWAESKKLRYEVSNGITLCVKHHPRKKEDVAQKITEFKKIIKKYANWKCTNIKF